jgi:ankyrin repeat protein
VNLAQCLVEHGASVIAQDHVGWTPLHEASRSGNVDLARFLVKHGADVTARDKHASTPLHEASRTSSRNVDLAQFLLDHGADVTAKDNDGWTPLYRASQFGNVDLAWFVTIMDCEAPHTRRSVVSARVACEARPRVL